MADTEATGESGVQFLESLAALPEDSAACESPPSRDPRGVDFAAYKRLNQTERMADLEARAIKLLNRCPS
jgi:predicted aconitase